VIELPQVGGLHHRYERLAAKDNSREVLGTRTLKQSRANTLGQLPPLSNAARKTHLGPRFAFFADLK